MPQAFSVTIKTTEGAALLQGAVMEHLGEMREDWLQPTMEAVGLYAREVAMSRQFEEEGGFLGAKWADIDPGYRDWKVDKFGAQADYIGRRTLSLRDALTVEREFFARTWSDGKQPHLIDAQPVLVATAHSVVIGAEVREDGEDYSARFNARRPIFGTGVIPPEAEFEMGKLMSIPYIAACHKAGAYVDWPEDNIRRWLDRVGRPDITRTSPVSGA